MCNPGSFYVNNEETNLPTARSTDGRCELTNPFVAPFTVNKCVNQCVNKCVDVPVVVNGFPTGAVTQACTQVCGEVCGDVTFPGNPTGKKWAPWDPRTNEITPATFFAHLNEFLPYTPTLCQQLCEQAKLSIPNVGNSFSTTGLNKISLLSPNDEYKGTYYQCMCGVTDGNCVLNTLLPTGDRYPDEDKWQTYDWTASAISICTNCK